MCHAYTQQVQNQGCRIVSVANIYFIDDFFQLD